MKKIIFISILLFVTNSFMSCKKEEVQESDKNFRIKEIVNQQSDYSIKFIFNYENDKLNQVDIMKEDGDQDWRLISKYELIYTTNKISLLHYYQYMSDEIVLQEKNEYFFNNNSLIENSRYLFHDGDYNIISKFTYLYTADRLIEMRRGDMKKWNLNYENTNLKDIIVLSNNLGSWSETYKLAYAYEEDRVSSIVFSDKIEKGWKDEEKWSHEYANGLLTTLRVFYLSQSENVWVEDSKTPFSYDAYGNLKRINFGVGDSLIMEFEEGNGNAYDIVNPIDKNRGIPIVFSLYEELSVW